MENISLDVKSGLKSFLSEVRAEGTVRKKSRGYEIEVSYALSPSAANWILAVVLFCFTLFGAAIILFPMIEKDKVGRAIRRAFDDLED